MTQRPYELLARFNANGTVAGVSARTITTVDDRDYISDPKPLESVDDPVFAEFAEEFSASATTERDSLKVERDELIVQRDELAQQLSEANTELERLRQPPHNVRMIHPESLQRRFTGKEIRLIALTADQVVAGFLAALDAAEEAGVLIDMDAKNTKQGIGYLAQAELIDPSRIAELLSDSLPSEV